MKLKISSDVVLEDYAIEGIKEELRAVEYELDQPDWMCSRSYLNRVLIKKHKLLRKLEAAIDKEFEVCIM